MMNKELLTQAKAGDAQALATLRRTTPASLTVFVAPDGNVDIAATLEAYEYYKMHSIQPDEWNDEPTTSFAQAFPVGVRRNPLTLKPVTPGLWKDLWNSKNGHKVVAGIHWGIKARAIQMSELELKIKVRQHLEVPDALLVECVRMMERDEGAYSMKAVNAPVEQVVPVVQDIVIASAEKRTETQGKLETLEQEYGRGMLDFGRYMRLKETLTTELHATLGSKWGQAKMIVFQGFIVRGYNSSEFRTLCFDLGIRYDDLGGRGLTAQVREFITHCQRHGLLDDAAKICRRQRRALWVETMGQY